MANALPVPSRFLLILSACLLAAGGFVAPARAQAPGAPKGTAVVIKHTTPETAERNKEFSVRASIDAAAGAYLPTLYYRLVGESRYYSLPLLPVPGSVSIYTASVPGVLVSKDIEYYLESYDTQLRGPGKVGDQKTPLKVPVIDPVVPPSQVVIRSDPSDAVLWVDGKEAGKTPWIGLLVTGTHELLLKKQGFLEAASTLDVPEGRDLDTLRGLTPAAEAAMFSVTSDPIGATVSIDGQVLGQTPLIAPSPDGEHILSVELGGFARAERAMLFSKERSIETNFTLTKLPPEPALAITSEPAGAAVFVDGKELGKTPFIGVVPQGEHLLLLKLEGRRSAQAQIVMPEDRDLDLRFTLEEDKIKRPPVIAVSSDPGGATVFLDGKDVGKTPFIQESAPGDHKVKVTYPGFMPYEKKVQVPEDFDLEVTIALVPEQKKGPSKVTFASNPPNAEINVDGKVVGKAPIQIELKPGQHVATARLDGHREVEERFTVVAGEGMSMKLQLAPLPKVEADKPPPAVEPAVSIVSEPPGAALTIDGKTMGEVPFQGTLKPGKHKLVLSLEGYKSREESIDLPKTNSEIRLRYTLAEVRKKAQLTTAAEAKKAEERKNVEIVKVEEVKSADKPATTATPAPSTTGAPCTTEPKVKSVPVRVYEAQPLEVGPIVLAGAGLASFAGAAVFGIFALNTAAQMANPDERNRATLFGQATQQVGISLGLGALGVVLGGAGAVWGALPKPAARVSSAKKSAAEPVDDGGEAKPVAPAPEAGGGGEAPAPMFRVDLGPGSAGVVVEGRF